MEAASACRRWGAAGFLAGVLSLSKNADYLSRLRTARAWRTRPSVFLGLEPESSGWLRIDSILSRALEIYESTLCKDCGTPARLGYDPDLDGWFETDTETVCYACAAREKYMRELKDPEPGLKIGVRLDPDYERRS